MNHQNDTSADPKPKKPLTYVDIIQRLVSRFIHETKKSMKMDGVNEDDLLEIKQDISSLRYELRDDRRKEIVRSSSHIDAVKRDIMRTMSSTTRYFPPRRQPNPRASVAEEESDYFDDSDTEVKSQGDSVYTTGGLSPTISTQYELPSITVAENTLPRRDDENIPMDFSEPPYRNKQPKSSAQSDTNVPTKPPIFDYSQPRAKPRIVTQKSAPSPLFANAVGPNASILEAVQTIRDTMNARLDQLIAQVTATHTDTLSPPNTYGTGIPRSEREKSEDPHAHLSSATGTRAHTPLSAPARSVSPSRVSFSSVQTIKDNKG
ncbi:transient-receptor-potential-like protein [Ditylenchus destructor]|nr:transient-receptor-potential-like protein [Ditylenchus destructor]